MSIRSTVVHSHTPWKLKPPGPRFGEALPAQDGTVGAAADGDFLRGQTGLFDGLAGVFDQVEVRLDLLDHVAVAVLDLHFHGAVAVLAVQVVGNVQKVVLLELELACVVVTQDVAELGLGHIAVHLAQVIEALTALGGLRAGHDGQGLVELHGHVGGVDHRVLRGAGVDREAVDRDGGAGGVEVLVLDAAHIAAIDGIGKVGPKAGDVEQGSALADLLIGGKGDAELAVGAALGNEGLGGGQDLRHTGLVVGTQQRGAVGGDEGLALQVFQEGEGGDLHDHAGGGQGDVAAIVVLVQDGVHVLTGSVRCGVHVGDKAQRRLVLAAGGGGEGAVDVAVLIYKGVLDADGLHILHKDMGQVELPLGRGMGAGIGVRGGVNTGIF